MVYWIRFRVAYDYKFCQACGDIFPFTNSALPPDSRNSFRPRRWSSCGKHHAGYIKTNQSSMRPHRSPSCGCYSNLTISRIIFVVIFDNNNLPFLSDTPFTAISAWFRFVLVNGSMIWKEAIKNFLFTWWRTYIEYQTDGGKVVKCALGKSRIQ